MKIFIFLVFFCLGLKADIVTTYKYIEDVAKQIGGEFVEVKALANSNFDPHFIPPKPSFIPTIKSAKLLIINGAGLEDAWLSPLINSANNKSLQILDLSKFVYLKESGHAHISRKMGDIHPEGDPHFHLNPLNLKPIAEAIKSKFCEIDSKHCENFEKNLVTFNQKLDVVVNQILDELTPFKDKKVITYHKLFDYFLSAFDIQTADCIEPLAGISPSAKHIEKLKQTIKDEQVFLIINDVYHSTKEGEYLSKQTNTKFVVLPHDVGSQKGVDDVFGLFLAISKGISN